jgi:glyoxylase-like metal-dependent hydrolase (beta-lactamase superfamily II)
MVYMIEDSLFTGDVLFEDGIGRCDLPTGNMVVMMRSLKELKNLYKNEDYIVYPGHGDATTLYKEIKTNYYLLKN